jgi:signal transduction histidine kinase/ActR/RegA family two-component response regulator
MDADAPTPAPSGRWRPSGDFLEWLALAALLIAACGYTAYALWDSHREADRAQRSRLERQGVVAERLLSTRLQATTNALDSLRADAPGILRQPDGVARLNERMAALVSAMAGVRTFLLVNADGVAVASNRPELRGMSFRDGERYKAIRANPRRDLLYVSPPFLTPLGNWALSLGRALLDDRDAFDGYVLAVIDPEYFTLLLESLRYAPDVSAAMIHGGGKLIWRVPDPLGAVGTDLSASPDSPFSRHLGGGQEATTVKAILASTGREALVSFRTIRPASGPSTGFLVASFSRETSSVFAAWRREVRDRAALLAVLTLGSIVGLAIRQRRRASANRLRTEREAERQRQDEARAALQAELAESRRLEGIGRLAGGVAHDFNNLLTVIISLGEESLARVKAGERPEAEDLEEVLAAARRAADLTRQLLAFARRQFVSPVLLDLNAQLRASEKLLRRVIGEDVRIVEHLEEGLWPVRCDPGLFGQLVVNLAANARDAMPGGGTISLSTRNVSLAPGEPVADPAMAPGDYVLLEVSDTGAGMTPEVLEHAFEPFFTTKGPGKGTGLGLATVYGIVRQSGGHVGVRSAPGKGATFQIFFPRQDGACVTPTPTPSSTGRGDETVLVVEDDAGVRAAVVQALRAGGYRVLPAATAEEALALARGDGGRIDLLLTDVVMPGRGGPEVARLVAAERPGIRVLFMSGYPDDALGNHGVISPGVDLVPKPFSPETLRARVRSVLDRPARSGAAA